MFNAIQSKSKPKLTAKIYSKKCDLTQKKEKFQQNKKQKRIEPNVLKVLTILENIWVFMSF